MITQVPAKPHDETVTKLLKQQYADLKHANKVQSINLSVMDHILDEIEQENIVIPQEKKAFKMKKNEEQKPKNEVQLSQLISKKQQIRNQLKKLQLQEYKLHINQSRLGLLQSRFSQSQSRLNPDRMFRSQMTQEEKQKIKEIIKTQKKFIKELKQKEKQYQQERQADRLKKIEIEENLKKQKCQERKPYWEKIRNDITKRQEQRQKKQIQDQSRLEAVKKSKKLYEVFQKSWKSKVEKDKGLINQKLKHSRETHKFSLNKIIEHGKEFDRVFKEKEQARLRMKQEFEEKVKLSLPKIQSKFLVSLKDEQRKKKIEEEEREMRRFQLSRKKSDFAQMVRKQYKPTIDENLKNTSKTFEIRQKAFKSPGLPFEETRNLGNEYMKNIHKHLEKSRELLKQTKTQASHIPQMQEVSKPLYKNYLNELKRKRNADEIKSSLTNEVHRIMKNSSLSAIQKIERTKLVARRLEAKESSKSSTLLNNINEKLKILKVLNQNQ